MNDVAAAAPAAVSSSGSPAASAPATRSAAPPSVAPRSAGPRSPAARREAGWRAFVLHRYDWSESSLILDLFTREAGRVVAAAKGAKRPSSSLRPVLMPFQPLQVVLARRHADDEDEVLTLRSAEWAGDLVGELAGERVFGRASDDCRGDLGREGEALPAASAAGTLVRADALFLGFYVNELLIKLLARGDPHPALFDAYAQTLAVLASSRAERRSQAALRAFEFVLLRDLGWLADLSLVTATQAAVLPQDEYVLRAEGGLTPTRGGEAVRGEHWLRIHAALADGAFGELRHACEHEGASALRTMLRHVLAMHLGGGLLRTREVALSLRRLVRR
jgi:DNA repair protein RecO (recombination protein O)